MIAAQKEDPMKNILIVEDEYFQADDLARVVDAAGFHVLGPFGHIAEVSERDVADANGAVLDVNLHGEMVFGLLDRLRARQIPLALLTGYEPHLIPARFASIPIFIKPDDCAKAVASVAVQIEQASSIDARRA